MPEVPQPIAYDAARQQIEGGAASFLAGLAPELVNAAVPAVEFKRGEVSVELSFQTLSPADFFAALEVVAPYFRQLGELRRNYRGCSFSADLYSALDRRRPDYRARKEEPPPPELPPPLEVTFRTDARGGGGVTLEKKAQLAQEEINC